MLSSASILYVLAVGAVPLLNYSTTSFSAIQHCQDSCIASSNNATSLALCMEPNYIWAWMIISAKNGTPISYGNCWPGTFALDGRMGTTENMWASTGISFPLSGRPTSSPPLWKMHAWLIHPTNIYHSHSKKKNTELYHSQTVKICQLVMDTWELKGRLLARSSCFTLACRSDER